MLRKIVSYHLAFLFLISNIGIPVYRHVCHTQARSWASIYIPAKSCCSKKNKSSANPCHLPPVEQPVEINSKPCCENHNGVLKLEIDFIHYLVSAETAPLSFWAGSAISGFVRYLDSRYEVSTSKRYSPGPMIPLHGRSLLISQQVFRC